MRGSRSRPATGGGCKFYYCDCREDPVFACKILFRRVDAAFKTTLCCTFAVCWIAGQGRTAVAAIPKLRIELALTLHEGDVCGTNIASLYAYCSFKSVSASDRNTLWQVHTSTPYTRQRAKERIGLPLSFAVLIRNIRTTLYHFVIADIYPHPRMEGQ